MSLLATTQGLIERTYRTATGIEDMGRFVVGDQGYRLLVHRDRPEGGASGGEGKDREPLPGARVLVRRMEEGLALAIYYPDVLIQQLERWPPTRQFDDRNVDAFAHFVEEIDHFISLYHARSHGRDLTLLELEMRANVSKALVFAHFIGRLAGRSWLLAEERLWMRYHLFEKQVYTDADAAVRQRYEDARRFAVRLLNRLEKLPRSRRIWELRRWNDLPASWKVHELSVA
ncbi:MAG: hypothetical protein ACE5HD_08125 [Acidobacteriota bacterium]